MRARRVVPAVALFLCGAFASVPATWLDAALAHASTGRWRLLTATGTVWVGSGTPAYVDAGGRVLALPRLSWSWRGRPLWRGRLAWQVTVAGSASPVRVEIGRGAGMIEALSLRLPAAVLVGLGDPWRRAGFDGDVRVDIPRLSWAGGRFDGGARLEWRAASSSLTPQLPFGRYALEADADGAGLSLHLATLAGPMALDGSGRWQPGGALQLSGRAECPPENCPSLAPLMSVLGPAETPTSVRWTVRAS